MFALHVGFVNVRVQGAVVLPCSPGLQRQPQPLLHQDPAHRQLGEEFAGCSTSA